MPSYENDPTMRDVAYTALLHHAAWFGDLRLHDSGPVITDFLKAWREAQYRHDTGGRNIYQWATTWADAHRDEYRARYPYLAPRKEVKAGEVD